MNLILKKGRKQIEKKYGIISTKKGEEESCRPLFKRPSHLNIFSFFLKKLPILSLLVLSILAIALSPNRSIRTVNLKVAVDEEYRSSKMWQFEIKRLIADSSADFAKYFGIKFKIKKIANWFSDNARESTYGLLSDLRKKVPQEDCDIVLGLTGQRQIKPGLFGAATYLHGYIIIRKLQSEISMRSLLKHELSHVFGAADINDESSYMNNRNLGHEFDEFTTRVILLNKDRGFNPYAFPLTKDKLNDAISLYNQRKEKNPGEPNVNILLALLYLEKKDYKSAIKECLLAIQIDPELAEAYSLSGIAYRRQGKIELAISAYHKVILSQPKLPEVHYNLGIAYMKKGMNDEAIVEYQRSIGLNPHFAKSYANLGHVYLEKGMVDLAIEECLKALEIYPQLAIAYSTLGGAYLLKNNLEEAESYSLKALELDNELAGAHNNLGSVYINKKMTDEAIKEYLRALAVDPEYPKAHYNLGRVFLLKGLIDEAISKFEDAIRLKPDYHKAYANMAAAYLEKGMADDAIIQCMKAIEIKPKYAHAYSNLGHAYLKKGRIKKAEEAFNKAIAFNRDLAAPHNLLGILFEKEERIEKAEAEYLKAIELKPDYLEAHLNLANLYFKMNRLPDSAAHYKRVIEIDPASAQAYNNLAVIFFYQKEYALARKYLSRAEDLGIKIHPEFKKEVRSKLKKKK